MSTAVVRVRVKKERREVSEEWQGKFDNGGNEERKKQRKGKKRKKKKFKYFCEKKRRGGRCVRLKINTQFE